MIKGCEQFSMIINNKDPPLYFLKKHSFFYIKFHNFIEYSIRLKLITYNCNVTSNQTKIL